MDEFALAYIQLGEALPSVWAQGLPSAAAVLKQLELGVDLTEAIALFAERENPLDPSDILADPLTIEQFRTRLGNYLLVMSFEELGKSNIQRYLKKFKAKYQGPPLTSPVLVPITERAQPASCWITPFFTYHREAVHRLFVTAGGLDHQGKDLLQATLQVFGLAVSARAIEDFEASGSVFDFEAAVQQWAARRTGLSKVFVNQLAMTRLQFLDLQRQAAGPLVDQLQVLTDELTELARKQNKHPKKLSSRALYHIFSFYAKALQTFSKRPSFDEIGENNGCLTLAKFLKLARDFNCAAKLKRTKPLKKWRHSPD